MSINNRMQLIKEILVAVNRMSEKEQSEILEIAKFVSASNSESESAI